MKKFAAFIISLIIVHMVWNAPAVAQDLQSVLEGQMKEATVPVTATFKSTRIMNGHSIERMPEGQLDFRISHRFGRLNSGAYELSGGARSVPGSLSWMSGVYVNGLRWSDPERDYLFTHRMEYAHQLLIARKFSPGFSLQLTPSYLHGNLVETAADPNDLFALGGGTRIKITSRISFNAEYFYVFAPEPSTLSSPIYNPLSIGFDLETGGHVFQLIFTNSVAMRENGFLGQTTGRWLDGDIHFGFNISRVFQLKKQQP